MMADPPRVSRTFLLMTALVTGAVVMALEILGSRLLAPVFGNSLFVWGALIGVILAAMSSGYAFGGWISDRCRGGTVLAALLLFSGGWTFLVAWASQPVLFQVEKLIEDPRWGPTLAAMVLLAPPAFGLSGVLPAMLRLAVADMEHLGRHTGRMIALSTVGSLLGTWGTAFFLLSWIGSQALVAWLGTVQVVLGLLWLWSAKPARRSGCTPSKNYKRPSIKKTVLTSRSASGTISFFVIWSWIAPSMRSCGKPIRFRSFCPIAN
jgi:hypothetical protein